MTDTGTDSPPVERTRLEDLVVFEYRALVVRRLGVTAEWRVLEWTTKTACRDRAAATLPVCHRCPVVAQCLAAAVATDDKAEWRGGLSRSDRQLLWQGLERTYREVRDFELMRLDVGGLVGRSAGTSAPTTANERS